MKLARGRSGKKKRLIIRPWESVTIRVFSGDASAGVGARIPALILYLVPLVLLGMAVGSILFFQHQSGETQDVAALDEQVGASVVDIEELRDELQGFTGAMKDVVTLLDQFDLGDSGENAIFQEYLSAEASDLERLVGPLGGGVGTGLQADIERLRDSRELLLGVTKRAAIIDRVKDEIPNRWPVVAGRGRVTMEFGPAIHPITGSWYLHKGFDVADFTGTPVLAMAEGTVTKSEFDPYGYGNQVIIKHKYGFETSYAHMSRLDVREGQWVEAGQRIGTIGMTGIATGTHVHVELFLGGQIIDPAPFIRLSNEFTPVRYNR